MNNSISENKNYFLKIFVLIHLIVALTKIQTASFSPINYYEHPVQTQVELLVSEGQPAVQSFYSAFSSPNNIVNATFPKIDYSTLYKYALCYYDNYLLDHYKSIENNYIPYKRSFSILQRKNSCYQSNDEDPLLFSYFG
ncbi:MAG: hypothetical protein NTX22_04270 [Ignavibacteriales bacterium]|nr:hypothetical protein [Ignavibacteriales bacterium]